MTETTIAFVTILLILLLAIEIGFRISRRDTSEGEVVEPEKIAANFVLTLLGLILAFTLNAARSHFSERAAMILSEAQSIRSARVALDDLSDARRAESLHLLTSYLESKKEYNRALNEANDPALAYEKGRDILHQIRRVCRMPAEGDEADRQRIALERIENVAEVGLERHVLVQAPDSDVVIVFLFALAVIACLLLGHSHRAVKNRAWWTGILFAGIISAALVLIIDYDSPRLGLIRVDPSDVLYDELGKQ